MSVNNLSKLESLKSTRDSLSKKISDLTTKRKAIDKQIQEIEEREYMNILKANECTIVSLSNDLALIKQIKESNLSYQDVLELINELGGKVNENS